VGRLNLKQVQEGFLLLLEERSELHPEPNVAVPAQEINGAARVRRAEHHRDRSHNSACARV